MAIGDSNSVSYGQAGGKGQFSRFMVEGGPTPAYPLFAGGSIISDVHPHLAGNRGGAYRWGQTAVGGIVNLIPDGGRLVSPNYSAQVANGQTLDLGGIGFYDQINTAIYARCLFIAAESISRYLLDVNGEFCWRPTGGTDYGAIGEPFTTAGTVTATNASTAIVGAGTAFTTATLPGYAYTTSKAVPVPGDIISIGAAGSRQFYRISVITDATHLTIFPAYQGTTGGGKAYELIRTGYGSASKPIVIPNSVTGDRYLYYAGNVRSLLNSPGAIECVVISGATYTVSAHYMSPQDTSATDVRANDVAYYKSFLLYGFGNAIGWSVAGFPTSFTTGFGATDFPANNVTVVDNTDTFVAFEYIGDQLIALFRESVWLVQQTGTVPEFQFYRLPEIIGAVTQGQVDGQVLGTYSYARGTVSARGRCFYVSKESVMELTTGGGHPITDGVNNMQICGQQANFSNLTWDKWSDTLVWYNGGTGGAGKAMCYRVPEKAWFSLDLGTSARAFSGGVAPTAGYFNDPLRIFGVAFWDATNKIMYTGADAALTGIPFDVPQTGTMLAAEKTWTWSSLLADTGALYPGFTFGGLVIDAWGVSASTPSLTCKIYGGSSPYSMTLRQTVALAYANGMKSLNKLGSKFDDRFIGVIITGTKWIDLNGVWIFDSSERSRR